MDNRTVDEGASNSNVSEESLNTPKFDCRPGGGHGRHNCMGRTPNRPKLLRSNKNCVIATLCSACRKEESDLCKRRNYICRTLQASPRGITAAAGCDHRKSKQIAPGTIENKHQSAKLRRKRLYSSQPISLKSGSAGSGDLASSRDDLTVSASYDIAGADISDRTVETIGTRASEC